MKRVLFSLLILAVAQFSFAAKEGVGGDPLAQEFAKITNDVALYLEYRRDLVTEIDRNKIFAVVDELKASLNGQSKIEIVDVRPLDRNGVEKAAVFLTEPLLVKVHRATWESATEQEKVTLCAMELLGIMGVEFGRYELAATEIGVHAHEVIRKTYGPGLNEILEQMFHYSIEHLVPVDLSQMKFTPTQMSPKFARCLHVSSDGEVSKVYPLVAVNKVAGAVNEWDLMSLHEANKLPREKFNADGQFVVDLETDDAVCDRENSLSEDGLTYKQVSFCDPAFVTEVRIVQSRLIARRASASGEVSFMTCW